MPSPRAPLRAAVSTAALVLLAGMLAGCAPGGPSHEVVAPIVLTEPGPGDHRDPADIGAEPVPPPSPAPAGQDAVRREGDDAPDGGVGDPAPTDADDDREPAPEIEPDEEADTEVSDDSEDSDGGDGDGDGDDDD